MKIKRILSFIFALLLTVSAVSCDNSSEVTQKTGNTLSEDTVKSEDAVKNTSEINEPVGDNRITVHYDEVKVCGEDLSPSYPRAATADKIYYEKTPDDLNWYEDEVNNDKRSGFIVDLEDSSVTSDDHEEILPYDIISRDDNKIFYLKYYNDDRYNQKKIVSFDLSAGSEKSTDYMDIYYPDSDHSGDIYITDAGIIKGYNKSLEIIKEIDLTDQIYQLRDEYGIAGMCVSDEGKIYISFTLNSGDGYKVFTIDDNDNLVSLTDKIMTKFIANKDNIFIDKSGNIVLAGKETVSVIDSNNGNIIHTYKLDYVVDFLGPSNKYDMVYMSSDGLYGYSFDDNKKELIVSDDVLPDLGSYYESAYLSGNKVYISLNDKSSSLKNTRTLYEIERKTGNIISKSAVSGIGMVNECIGDDGLLYYIASTPLPKKPEAVYRYEYSVYRHENYGDNTLLFKFPEIPNHNMSQGIIVNSRGEIMIPYMGGIGTKGVKPFIKVYDTAGNLKTTVYPENDNGCCEFILIQNDNGRIYIVEVNEDNTAEIHKYDETNYSIGEKVGEFESRYKYQNGFGDYDIILSDSSGIYGWKEETGTKTTIAKYCDLHDFTNDYEMFSALVISENEILCHNGIKLVKAEGERLSELNSKEIVTLAVPSSDRISSLISEFNEQNDSCYILLKDYSRYDECTSYYYGDICEFASEALAKEIENNDIPDIIMMNDLDLSSYIVNGMFADMKKFADADSQFDLNDIHEYIIDAFTYNDCLYTIPAKTLQCVLFSDEKFDKWDYNDFISAETSGKYKFSSDTLNYRSITTDIFTPYYNDHVDIQNKKCDFDNEEFISLINHLKEVGLTEDKVKEITNYEYKLKRSSIYSVDDYLYGTGKKYEGSTETPYVVGWPSENGGKIIMKPLLSFGITNQSEHKETAWEFVKYVINKANNEPDAVNDGFATDTVPSSVSVTEEYIRTSANRSESNKFTAEDKKQYLSIFTMPVVTDFMYRKVSDIVNSELDEYFYSEDRTAEEVAEYIQNKVAQYLNEIS